jgi:hypothetical protein
MPHRAAAGIAPVAARRAGCAPDSFLDEAAAASAA